MIVDIIIHVSIIFLKQWYKHKYNHIIPGILICVPSNTCGLKCSILNYWSVYSVVRGYIWIWSLISPSIKEVHIEKKNLPFIKVLQILLSVVFNFWNSWNGYWPVLIWWLHRSSIKILKSYYIIYTIFNNVFIILLFLFYHLIFCFIFFFLLFFYILIIVTINYINKIYLFQMLWTHANRIKLKGGRGRGAYLTCPFILL